MGRNIVKSVVDARVARAISDRDLASRLKLIARTNGKVFDASERRAYLEEAARRLIVNDGLGGTADNDN